MTQRFAATLAWALCASSVLSTASGTTLLLASGLTPLGEEQPPTMEVASFYALAVAIAVVGCIIIRHRPANRIGWLFSSVGAAFGLSALADGYTRYAIVERPTLPGIAWAGWLSELLSTPAEVALVTFSLLWFPSGYMPSPRWRVISWAAGLSLVLIVLYDAIGKPALIDYPFLANPARVASVAGLTGGIQVAVLPLLTVALLGSIASLVTRFRRATGIERLQLTWFVYAATLIVAATLAAALLSRIGLDGVWIDDALWFLSSIGAVAGLPAIIGVAIVRYRLYEIDRIVNRTLVYTLLTTALLGVYFLLVLGLGMLVRTWTGGGSRMVVALSTLAVAALFQPLRMRFQRLVDRRFNRSRYDAARAIEQFGVRLRGEIDLDTLSIELLGIVRQTVQPTQASLWLRQLAPNRAEDATPPGFSQPETSGVHLR